MIIKKGPLLKKQWHIRIFTRSEMQKAAEPQRSGEHEKHSIVINT
ncbi:hypothetical protein Hanom_Chr07g00643871 [Helianthus anomalus]